MAKSLVAVTGASSGIGEAFVRRLAAGHDLLLIARRKDRLEQLANEMSQREGSRVEIVVADLTIEEDAERVAKRLAAEPELALLVNNAGFGTRGRFWEAPLAPQEEMHRLHVLAPLKLTYAVLPGMVQRDYGAIVNVASVAAFVRQPGGASYAATKTWMTAFTEALYLDLRNARSNVTVQALCPGYTYSEFHDKLGADRLKLAPRAFWMTAEEVVEASLQGLKRKKLFVIPGWHYRLLVGALTKLPSALRVAVESSLRKRKTAPTLLASQTAAQLGEGK